MRFMKEGRKVEGDYLEANDGLMENECSRGSVEVFGEVV
jgi:hypothetical protein